MVPSLETSVLVDVDCFKELGVMVEVEDDLDLSGVRWLSLSCLRDFGSFQDMISDKELRCRCDVVVLNAEHQMLRSPLTTFRWNGFTYIISGVSIATR